MMQRQGRHAALPSREKAEAVGRHARAGGAAAAGRAACRRLLRLRLAIRAQQPRVPAEGLEPAQELLLQSVRFYDVYDAVRL